MDYIGIAFKKPIDETQFVSLKQLAIQYGFDLLADKTLSLNDNVAPGLKHFCKISGIHEVLFFNKPTSGIVEYDSKGISLDLSTYYHSEANSNTFVNFIAKHFSLFCPFYLICAFEWPLDTLIYYEEIRIDELSTYFKTNNGIYKWLYSTKNKLPIRDFGTPVVIKLIK